MALGTPLEHGSFPGRPRDLDRNSKYQHFLTFWPPLGAPRAHFGPQGSPEKGPKSTWGGKVGTLGCQEGSKISSKGGSRNGSEKGDRKLIENESFWEAKNLNKYRKVVQNQGFEVCGNVSTNHRKFVPKWTPKVLYALRDTAAPLGNRWMKVVE